MMITSTINILEEIINLERKTNYEHFQTVQAGTIAERRAGILERGRKQT